MRHSKVMMLGMGKDPEEPREEALINVVGMPLFIFIQESAAVVHVHAEENLSKHENKIRKPNVNCRKRQRTLTVHLLGDKLEWKGRSVFYTGWGWGCLSSVS